MVTLMWKKERNLGIYFGMFEILLHMLGSMWAILMKSWSLRRNLECPSVPVGKWRISKPLWRHVFYMVLDSLVQNLLGVIKGVGCIL
jgi:hypothetical protein